MRPKRCKHCKQMFQPTREMQPYCGPLCERQGRGKLKKKKPKLEKLSTLQRKADDVTSIYIRMKYADHAGCVTCITCEKYLRWQDAHCAHFVERRAVKTRWLEENLHPACPGCNVFNKEFHKRQYTLYMIDMYGREMVDDLNRLAKEVVAPSQKRKLAEDAIAYFKGAVEALA